MYLPAARQNRIKNNQIINPANPAVGGLRQN